MTRCESCGHSFTNFLSRRKCPKCGEPLVRQAAASSGSDLPKDDSIDVGGFMFGLATGIPFSPAQGISVASVLGASLHSSPAPAATEPSPSFSCEPSEPGALSSSYESSSNMSSSDGGAAPSSCDSGGSW